MLTVFAVKGVGGVWPTFNGDENKISHGYIYEGELCGVDDVEDPGSLDFQHPVCRSSSSSRIPKKFLVGLKRTWDKTLSSGLMLVIFVTTHLFQFYFADTVHSRIQVVCTFGNALVGEFMVPFLLVFTVFRTAVNSDFVYSSTACFDGFAFVDDREEQFRRRSFVGSPIIR